MGALSEGIKSFWLIFHFLVANILSFNNIFVPKSKISNYIILYYKLNLIHNLSFYLAKLDWKLRGNETWIALELKKLFPSLLKRRKLRKMQQLKLFLFQTHRQIFRRMDHRLIALEQTLFGADQKQLDQRPAFSSKTMNELTDTNKF